MHARAAWRVNPTRTHMTTTCAVAPRHWLARSCTRPPHTQQCPVSACMHSFECMCECVDLTQIGSSPHECVGNVLRWRNSTRDHLELCNHCRYRTNSKQQQRL